MRKTIFSILAFIAKNNPNNNILNMITKSLVNLMLLNKIVRKNSKLQQTHKVIIINIGIGPNVNMA